MKKGFEYQPIKEEKKDFFNPPNDNFNINYNMNNVPKENKNNKKDEPIIPSKKVIKFQTSDEDINKKFFEFDTTLTIENMLLEFLGKTNSKMTLDPKQITFLFAGRVINQENDLKKTVGEIFKKKNNIPIKVIDTNDVIGGK